ncbi:MAG: hypothetical protein KC917_01490 [Candidatus Omnitrophica bacterium]|nr:hypothetical protein [Candidatus Omnitrophota bacterium]
MPLFPGVDPIPLPAPVWLFKALELVTVTLHFLAVQAFVGALLVAIIWSLRGRASGNQALIDGSGIVVNRLPVLMTYVINLGVPPLLFAQVLYGRALYTSSVLMGAFWISVIFLLMADYALLYVLAGRAKEGRPWGWIGLSCLLLTLAIGYIYSTNMTLMNRPEVWTEMYRAHPQGLNLNTGDPTVVPRWLFMMTGGLTTGGVVFLFLARKKFIAPEAASQFARTGPILILLGVIGQLATGTWAVMAQKPELREALFGHVVFGSSVWLWVLAMLAMGAVGFLTLKNPATQSYILPGIAGAVLFLEVLFGVVARSGIRDLTLLSYGLDVWDRQVASNWLVVGAFLLLFVLAIGVLFWLATVVARAKGVEERYV